MGKRSKQSRTRASKPNVLESITGDDALAILEVLAARDRRLAQRIEAVARERFSSVERDTVAANVMMELESLDIEEAWDRSGSTRDGYVEPGEAASEMFEEALRPFRDEMAKYRQLSMSREAELVCQGILKGIYDFEEECSSGDLWLDQVHNDSLQRYRVARKAWAVGTLNRTLGVLRRILELSAELWRDEQSGLTWLAVAPMIKLESKYKKRQPYPLGWDEHCCFRSWPDICNGWHSLRSTRVPDKRRFAG